MVGCDLDLVVMVTLRCAAGNLVALGTMEPTIEIWDLDVMESIGPAFTLGSQPEKKKKKSKKVSKTVQYLTV